MLQSANEFISRCEQENRAESTIESHKTALRLYSEWVVDNDVVASNPKQHQIEDFIEWLKASWDQDYIEIKNIVFKSLNEFFDYLVEEGSCAKNPCDNLDIVETLVIDQAISYLRRVRSTSADTTVQNREFGLLLFSNWLEQVEETELEDLRPIDLENYAIYLTNQGYANGTVSDRFSAVAELFRFLHDKSEILEENPIEKVDLQGENILDYDADSLKSQKLKEDIYYVTKEEKEKLVEHCPSPKIRNELLIKLMWQTGLRLSEVANIQIDDCDFEQGEIEIRGKNGKNRTVYYQPSLKEMMRIWRKGGPRQSSLYAEESPYLFLSDQSDQLHPQHIYRVIMTAAENAGIQQSLYEDANGNTRYKITPHGLRHGFAVRALKNGMDIKMLADRLGHNSLDTTKEYLKFAREDERAAYRKYGPGGTAED